MAKEEGIEVEGVVVEHNQNIFIVKMAKPNAQPVEDAALIQAYLGGKMRQNNIRIVPGDRVKVVVSPYDISKGRIVYRMKG